MRYLRLRATDQRSQIAGTSADSTSADGNLDLRHCVDRIIMNRIFENLVSRFAQRRHLGFEALVFTAGLLVVIVRDQNLHK